MAREIYDYSGLPIAVAQHDKTLSISTTIAGGSPIRNSARKRVTINKSRNGVNEERISHHGSGEFDWFISIRYDILTPVDATTILDFWHDPAYGDGPLYTWYLACDDGHTYTVRFDQDTFDHDILRFIESGEHYKGFAILHLACLGKKAD